MVTAGRHDPICPLPQTEALARWLEGQGARLEMSLRDGGHGISRRELTALADFLSRA